MGLSFDDSPSNLAAATLFYLLISDGQDEQLLESPSCIQFLIKLLKPVTSVANEDKLPRIGSKLLRVRNDAGVLRGTSSKLDRSSVTIISRVKEILGSCKELKSTLGDDCALGRPELSAKWIALSTMEKASVSTISLEETSGIVRKTGGNFKEKLREFGGLDAVFEVAMHCHSVMEDLKDSGSSSIWHARDGTLLESLVLLLKCLKIMENATFLSKDNQDYLLKMQGSSDHQGYRLSFTKLVLNVIKILSGLSLRKSSAAAAHDDKSNMAGGVASELALIPEDSADEVFSFQSFKERCSMEESSSQRSSDTFQDNHWLSSAPSRYSSSFPETKTSSLNGSCLLKSSVSAASGSCGETSKSSSSQTIPISNGLKNFSRDKRCDLSESSAFDLSEDSEDPYAFDEDEFEPSKWEVLSGKKGSSKSKRGRLAVGGAKDVVQLQPMKNKDSDSFEYPMQDSNTCESHQSQEAFCSGATDEESTKLLADCLLTAVKVLMNLTNDNILGCQQIATCGGLETMASIIAAHFPSFSSSSSSSFSLCEIEEYGIHIEFDHQRDNHLTDQEMDFLVAILGLLVNLVEKDESNSKRTRDAIAGCLPNRNLAILVPVLERFVAFHLTLDMMTPETHKAVSEVIESCRIP
ncbi:hypothetical protein CRG98_039487 [Punica granatum]|uniref:Wings apart-like protein C-terminal domain-containing protein n=1 Tax=Punica granatum TaxID=22663 RepID=A0A2I0I7Y6_PUNGR|nr:hypothetical protein CRG98_039487 [Punica granatum]